MSPGDLEPGRALATDDDEYEHLGRFSDWVGFAHWQCASGPESKSGELTPARAREALGFAQDKPPLDVRLEGKWERDGVAGEEISWSVGYGPRAHAWLLRPDGARGPLPGVLALHDHSGFKYFGREKIADGPGGPDPLVTDLRRRQYGNRAFANELAREGFSVLAHDVFLWGSRRFSMDEMTAPEAARSTAGWVAAGSAVGTMGDDAGAERIRTYNQAAIKHEHLIAKYCTLLGTSLAGVVAYEDRVALAYLRSRPDVISERVGCVGLSGGGCRAALMQATSDISAAVIVDMMSTYDQLLSSHVDAHTWMLFPPCLVRVADWPDVAACRAPSPLLVQYSRDDQLFSLKGMMAAHERIAARYSSVGAPENYVGQFFDGEHRFDKIMQAAAFDHLARWLSA